ncbi:uncharacterized protein LOC125039140 [Penaeus chinensis]|uniref:uncharacterized protein LOC125039140 n=1 Tax=Penaeus chinensis TaxID=139456 RepID=UPI001FB62F36|nr:uncharacterized protein LOC125039140 [Penaeus chinensis]
MFNEDHADAGQETDGSMSVPSESVRELAVELYKMVTEYYAEDREVSATLPWSRAAFTLIAIIFGAVFVPLFKITASIVLAAAFRAATFLIFSPGTMAKIVGSEGYIYYAQILVKHYVGFGPFFALFTNPLEAVPKLLNL